MKYTLLVLGLPLKTQALLRFWEKYRLGSCTWLPSEKSQLAHRIVVPSPSFLLLTMQLWYEVHIPNDFVE